MKRFIHMIDNYVSGDVQINEYLSSLSESDKAFVNFLSQLDDAEEKTAVLMFGDHQPSIYLQQYVETVDSQINSDCIDYIVPYVIWANYELDVDEEYDIISANYLSAVFKETIGIPLNKWDQFRLDTIEEYPVITAKFVFDKEGKMMLPDEAVPSNELVNYNNIQYMRLYDR